MGVKQWMKGLAEEALHSQYESKKRTLRGSYPEWLAKVMPDDPMAEIQSVFVQHPEVLILYGDEDAAGADENLDTPWFRPDWSPETLESHFYFGSLIAFRRSFLEKELPDWRDQLQEFVISQEQDTAVVLCNEIPTQEYRTCIYALCRQAGGWKRGCRALFHMQAVLHHCSSAERLMAFGKMTMPAAPFAEKKQALLSVIIPSKDHPELLEQCLLSLKRAVGDVIPYEVLVVDNGSSAENRERIEKITGIRYLYQPQEFHFSRMCNLGAKEAKGEFLLFLNDDVELTRESKVAEMLELSDREGVGSVGIKLYYPDSTMLQHAGITNLPAGPMHKLIYLDDSEEYYFGMNRGTRNVLAVTAACVLLRADRFWEAGGFEEELRIAYNDAALGFRLYELGYRNVCMCDAYGYHHESLTRGSDDGGEKRERLIRERKKLRELFPDLAGKDPYFPEALDRSVTDNRVRPAYETMYQTCTGISLHRVRELTAYREDPCLMLCAEETRDGEIRGYYAVLGDDNACYEWEILLEDQSGECYGAALPPLYRPDLQEKLPDQKNVELNGFWVRIAAGELPAGQYRIGILARRRVGRIRLLCRCKCTLNL